MPPMNETLERLRGELMGFGDMIRSTRDRVEGQARTMTSILSEVSLVNDLDELIRGTPEAQGIVTKVEVLQNKVKALEERIDGNDKRRWEIYFAIFTAIVAAGAAAIQAFVT